MENDSVSNINHIKRENEWKMNYCRKITYDNMVKWYIVI